MPNWGSLIAEALAVGEEQPVLPLPDRPGRRDQGHDHRQAGVDAVGVGADDPLVATDQLVLGVGGVGARS